MNQVLSLQMLPFADNDELAISSFSRRCSARSNTNCTNDTVKIEEVAA